MISGEGGVILQDFGEEDETLLLHRNTRLLHTYTHTHREREREKQTKKGKKHTSHTSLPCVTCATSSLSCLTDMSLCTVSECVVPRMVFTFSVYANCVLAAIPHTRNNENNIGINIVHILRIGMFYFTSFPKRPINTVTPSNGSPNTPYPPLFSSTQHINHYKHLFSLLTSLSLSLFSLLPR